MIERVTLREILGPKIPPVLPENEQRTRAAFLAVRQSVLEDPELRSRENDLFSEGDCLGLTWSRLLRMAEKLKDREDFSKDTWLGLVMSQEIMAGIWAEEMGAYWGIEGTDVLSGYLGEDTAREVSELMKPLEEVVEIFFEKLEKRRIEKKPDDEYVEIELKDVRNLVGFVLNQLESNVIVTSSPNSKRRAVSKSQTGDFRLGVQLARSVWGDLSSNG